MTKKKILAAVICAAVCLFTVLGVGGFLIYDAYEQILDIYESGNYLGRGIQSVNLVSSEGNVDTYKITFTDKSELTYNITNGERGYQGVKGDKGETGMKGDTGAQGIQGVQGEKGDKGERGETGKSAYQIYVENFDYTGSESDWLLDLINGNLRTVCYTVSFNSDGGSEVESQIINVGEKAVKPQNPTRPGYIFLGWYIRGEAWNFTGSVVTEDVTLIAGWAVDESYSPSTTG